MEETEQLTYAELAARLGIGVESARKVRKRHHWGTITGNDGVVKVKVPIDYLAEREAKRPVQDNEPRTSPEDEVAFGVAVLFERIESLARHLETTRSLAKAESGRADGAELLVESERRRADAEFSRAESERARADAATRREDESDRRALSAESELDLLREAVDLASLPWWRRIRQKRQSSKLTA